MAKKLILYPHNGYGDLINYTSHYQEYGDIRPTDQMLKDYQENFLKWKNRLPFKEEYDKYVAEKTVIWRMPREFTATLQVVDYHLGRSAFNLIVQVNELNKDTWTAHIFGADVLDITKNIVKKPGITDELNLKYAKKGSNYGLVLKKED